MITGSEMNQVVYGYWATRFSCAVGDFARAGTLVIQDEELAAPGTVFIYHIDRMSVVRIAPALEAEVGLLDWHDKETASLTVGALKSLVEPRFSVEVGRTLLDTYLDGKDLEPFSVPGGLAARRLYPEDDAAHLLGLYGACTEEELDAAAINVEEPDPVIFGLFDQGHLVAYASHRYWGETIADIGVLIHPDYRNRGLGKAVVSVLCEWCLANDIVPMYRVFSDHQLSRRVGEALGFQEMVAIESVELVKEGGP